MDICVCRDYSPWDVFIYWLEVGMKLEIEITEEEIKSSVERKVRTAIADQTSQWGNDTYIKQQVKIHWEESVDALITEAIGNSEALRAKINTAIEKKLRAQLAAALRIKETK